MGFNRFRFLISVGVVRIHVRVAIRSRKNRPESNSDKCNDLLEIILKRANLLINAEICASVFRYNGKCSENLLVLLVSITGSNTGCSIVWEGKEYFVIFIMLVSVGF